MNTTVCRSLERGVPVCGSFTRSPARGPEVKTLCERGSAHPRQKASDVARLGNSFNPAALVLQLSPDTAGVTVHGRTSFSKNVEDALLSVLDRTQGVHIKRAGRFVHIYCIEDLLTSATGCVGSTGGCDSGGEGRSSRKPSSCTWVSGQCTPYEAIVCLAEVLQSLPCPAFEGPYTFLQDESLLRVALATGVVENVRFSVPLTADCTSHSSDASSCFSLFFPHDAFETERRTRLGLWDYSPSQKEKETVVALTHTVGQALTTLCLTYDTISGTCKALCFVLLAAESFFFFLPLSSRITRLLPFVRVLLTIFWFFGLFSLPRMSEDRAALALDQGRASTDPETTEAVILPLLAPEYAARSLSRSISRKCQSISSYRAAADLLRAQLHPEARVAFISSIKGEPAPCSLYSSSCSPFILCCLKNLFQCGSAVSVVICLSTVLVLVGLLVDSPVSFCRFVETAFASRSSCVWDVFSKPAADAAVSLLSSSEPLTQCLLRRLVKGVLLAGSSSLLIYTKPACLGHTGHILLHEEMLPLLPWLVLAWLWPSPLGPGGSVPTVQFPGAVLSRLVCSRESDCCLAPTARARLPLSSIGVADGLSEPLRALIWLFLVSFSEFESSVLVALTWRLCAKTLLFRRETETTGVDHRLAYQTSDALLEMVLMFLSLWHPRLPILLLVYFRFHPKLFLESLFTEEKNKGIPMRCLVPSTHTTCYNAIRSAAAVGVFVYGSVLISQASFVVFCTAAFLGLSFSLCRRVNSAARPAAESVNPQQLLLGGWIEEELEPSFLNEECADATTSSTKRPAGCQASVREGATTRSLNRGSREYRSPALDLGRLEEAARLLVSHPQSSLTTLTSRLATVTPIAHPAPLVKAPAEATKRLLPSVDLQFLNRFLGTWKLIKSRSDPMENVSRALGVSWAIRRAIEQFTPSCQYVRNGSELIITTFLPFNNTRVMRLYVDNKEHFNEDSDLGAWRTVTRCAPGRPVLLSRRKRESDGLCITETRQILTEAWAPDGSPDVSGDVLWYLVEVRQPNFGAIIASSNRFMQRTGEIPSEVLALRLSQCETDIPSNAPTTPEHIGGAGGAGRGTFTSLSNSRHTAPQNKALSSSSSSSKGSHYDYDLPVVALKPPSVAPYPHNKGNNDDDQAHRISCSSSSVTPIPLLISLDDLLPVVSTVKEEPSVAASSPLTKQPFGALVYNRVLGSVNAALFDSGLPQYVTTAHFVA